MSRKKVVLFIVEGISDRESLELILTELEEGDNEIIFQVVSGDITSNRNVDRNNIQSRLTKIIEDGGKRKFKASDYREVVHLVDMDAAFISEDNIYKNSYGTRFIYNEDGIYAKRREDVIERNNKKKEILNILIDTEKVYKSVPYRVFYFACNLEHVLYDEIQIPDRAKMKYAEEFQDRYIDDLEGFLDLICNSSFTVRKKYKQSWKFIKENNNSIKRFTNFNIFLNRYNKHNR